MPSGNVTRSTFFGSFSGSISTAATAGIPDSTRPSLPVKQICKIFMALASSPFCLALASPPRQNLVHGEKVSCGCSACACGCRCACGAAVSAGFCAGAGFGTGFGAAQCGEHGRCRCDGKRACGRPRRRKNQPVIHRQILFLTVLPAPHAGTVAPHFRLCRGQFWRSRGAGKSNEEPLNVTSCGWNSATRLTNPTISSLSERSPTCGSDELASPHGALPQG